jgi:prepilin-type N-terminal cleavage/methylation domain-containing protein
MTGAPSPGQTLRVRRGSRAAGYTAVEVLMAMTVMAIGAAAVISMQRATIQGDMDARQTDIANSIARTWVERLQEDAMQWTLPSSANPAGNNCANAQIACANAAASPGAWFLPNQYNNAATGTNVSWSPGFDILGRDVASGTPLTNAFFCVNVRLVWLVAPSLPVEPGLIRADVRVLWPRGLYGSPIGLGTSPCTVGVASAADPNAYTAGQQPLYHAIYLTTTIKENSQ